ncbi:UvrD-helicase domain-containing protein [Halosquirtibacter laminarini]|uniref:UvrD-helicase domain-containing protein n=1 Tax=Halosquirtibacter laminarini TaxID=3374600 RepID=A0AC61NBI5_9BACT|nr:UvrD-helicase domain-containing protein [Prolixibacteraceae bacterium]
MKKISLDQEQLSLAKFNSSGPFAIKGIAGSGKTTVGLKRLQYLRTKATSEDKILVVTYHKVLTDYLKYLGDEGEDIFEEEVLDNQELFQHKKEEDKKPCGVDIINIDKLVHQYYSKYRDLKKNHKHYKSLPRFTSPYRDLHETFMQSLEILKDRYPDSKVLKRDYNFLKKEIDFINNCRIVSEKSYQIFSRVGRNRNEEQKYTIPKKSQARRELFELRREYNNNLIIQGKMDFPVMRLLAIRYISENPPMCYQHIIIDECQDLDRSRMDFLKFFLKDNNTTTATFLYDNAQSIYEGSWLGNGHAFSSLGINILGNRSRILKYNYRTTYEIQSAAQSLIKHNNYKQEIEPVMINKGGVKPFLAECKTQADHDKYIIDTIKNQERNLDLKDIIVACRTNQEAERLTLVISDSGIDCTHFRSSQNNFKNNTVRVMTINCTKGLESEMVILANLNKDVIPVNSKDPIQALQDLRILYVGMTRASNILHLVSYEESSPFIQNMPLDSFKLVDLEQYQEFVLLEKDMKQEVRSLISQLMDELALFEQIRNEYRPESNFQECFENLMTGVINIERITDKAEEIHVKLDQNSSLKNLISSFIETCLLKKHLAREEMMKFSRCPFKMESRKKNLEKRYPYFSEESIQSLASIGHLTQQNQKESIDYSSFISGFSKILEIELHNIFEERSYFDNANFEGTKQFGSGTYKLYDILKYIYHHVSGTLNDINESLEYINFRKQRNKATHAHCVRLEEYEVIEKEMLRPNGIIDMLHDQLEKE